MQLSSIVTFVLAAAGAVSAAPTSTAELHEAHTLTARAWPALGGSIITSAGECHGSGRWGKRDDAIRAIEQFCREKATGQRLTGSIKGSYRYDNKVYRWDLEIRPYGTPKNPLSNAECNTAFVTGLDYCKGNNQDTRGGKGIIESRNLWVSIDPNDV